MPSYTHLLASIDAFARRSFSAMSTGTALAMGEDGNLDNDEVPMKQRFMTALPFICIALLFVTAFIILMVLKAKKKLPAWCWWRKRPMTPREKFLRWRNRRRQQQGIDQRISGFIDNDEFIAAAVASTWSDTESEDENDNVTRRGIDTMPRRNYGTIRPPAAARPNEFPRSSTLHAISGEITVNVLPKRSRSFRKPPPAYRSNDTLTRAYHARASRPTFNVHRIQPPPLDPEFIGRCDDDS
ncbi:unnamed protein product [Sympodiomycopsis kandeliae]